jgi:hypothetical protein
VTAERETVQTDKTIQACTDTEAYVEQLLAETGPLTSEERLHLTRLLTAPDRGDDAAA